MTRKACWTSIILGSNLALASFNSSYMKSYSEHLTLEHHPAATGQHPDKLCHGCFALSVHGSCCRIRQWMNDKCPLSDSGADTVKVHTLPAHTRCANIFEARSGWASLLMNRQHSGRTDFWTHGFLDARIFGRTNFWTRGFLDARIFGRANFWTH